MKASNEVREENIARIFFRRKSALGPCIMVADELKRRAPADKETQPILPFRQSLRSVGIFHIGAHIPSRRRR